MGEETISQYPAALIKAREVAISHGYALGVHGSQTFDLDVIACPWVDQCSSPEDLAFAIAQALEWHLHSKISEKPQGRKGFLIYGPNHAHIDLSVMPRIG